jgi:hypothetical protein
MRLRQILMCSAIAFSGITIQIRDIDGKLLSPFSPAGKANVLFFLTSDCPISNSYAPEIQRICRDYAAKGVNCALLYEDMKISAAAARTHLQEYGYRGIPAAIDAARTIANGARATVTPQAVVIDARGDTRYRGRIDNFYAALGKSRQQVTVRDVRAALDAVIAGKKVTTPESEAFGCYIVPPDTTR